MSEQVKNGKSIADHVRKIDKGLEEMKGGLEEVQVGVHSLASYLEYVESEVIRAHTEVDAINDRFKQMDDGFGMNAR